MVIRRFPIILAVALLVVLAFPFLYLKVLADIGRGASVSQQPWTLKIDRSCSVLILKIHNDTPQSIDIPSTTFAARLMVDGAVHKCKGVVWNGPGDLSVGKEFDWEFDPKVTFGADIAGGSHIVSVEFGKRWSNRLAVTCR